MRAALAVLLLVACGSTQPARHEAATERAAWSPAQPTCEEVGIILRGSNDERTDDGGPAKEKVIAAACQDDRWSPSVIACVAGTFDAHDCLQQLSPAQHVAYDKRLAAWAVKYGAEVGESPEPPVTCFDALHAIELFDPPITDASPERVWESAVRQRALVGMCSNDTWTAEAMRCLRDATTESATSTCVAKLDPKVHMKLLVLRDLAKAIEALRKTPTKIDCKKVAERHYSDARVKSALEKLKPAERKMIVDGVRKTMAGACTSEAWDDATRACMVADGGEETCIGTVRFGALTAGTFDMFSIPLCAQYAEVVMEFQRCKGAPKETRDAMLNALQEIDRSSTHASPDQKAALTTMCQTATNSVRSVLSAYGC